MKKKTFLEILLFLILLLLFVAICVNNCLKYIVSAYFSNQFKTDIKIHTLSLKFKDGIQASGIDISNKTGLKCKIDRALIQHSITSLSRGWLAFDITLEGVKLYYPESAIIKGITNVLSLESVDSLAFDSVKARIERRGSENLIKNLSAEGKTLRLHVDGSIGNNSMLDCSFKILLSKELVSNIPEKIRKIFFTEDGAWSEVELDLKGDIKRPSINFSTNLFKLIVH
jgi:hypothetical protein